MKKKQLLEIIIIDIIKKIMKNYKKATFRKSKFLFYLKNKKKEINKNRGLNL